MAFTYVSDAEEVPIFKVQDLEESTSDVPDLAYLKEAGVSAQRLAVSRCARSYGGGSARSVATFPANMTGEKMFHIEKLVSWIEPEPEVLCAEMRKGRLRCRVVAAMGKGKSTFMPPYLARSMGFRVLLVTLNATALQQTVDYVHAMSMGRFSRRWSERQKEWLVGMTYADFNGYMASASKAELFRAFELIIFDEADMDVADVFVAKRAFAVHALPTTHLILCSATIQKVAEGEEHGGAEHLGSFRVIDRTVSVSDAIASGRLVGTYLADRTCVFAPGDEEVSMLGAHYAENGVESYVLDSAAHKEDVVEVAAALSGDSSTPRVVVAHYSHGIALNMPISQPLIFPWERTMKIVDDVATFVDVPMTEDYITQCKSRSGRGIVEGSGGAVFGSERRTRGDLRECDKLEAFVKLFAASIVPSRTGFWTEQYEMFPKGMSAHLATSLIKICLPMQVSIRFFCSDGYVASKYCKALNIFSQPNMFLRPSDTEIPPGEASWSEESIIGSEKHSVAVPVHAEGELQIVIQTIVLIAKGLVDVPRWIPAVGIDVNDGYDSGDERRNSRKMKKPELRRVENRTYELPSVPERPKLPWAYEHTGAVGRRTGGVIDSDRVKDALRRMEEYVQKYAPPSPKLEDVAAPVGDDDEVEVLYGQGNVESPGGGTVCVLPRKVCEMLNEGNKLGRDEMVTLVFAARADPIRFAASKLFDAYSRPWDSIIDTVADEGVLRQLVKRGLMTDTFHIVDQLRRRFSVETANVLANSNVYKTKFMGLFPRLPSFDKVMKAVQAGKFDHVAQTTGFLDRVRDLKARIDHLLLRAEGVGVYLPTHITAAQRQLPLRGENVLGYTGDGLQAMPTSWSKQLRKGSWDGAEIKYPLGKGS